MRIPLARDGYVILVVTTLILGGIGFAGSLLTPWAWLPVAVVWVWALSFFRDPERSFDREPSLLYSPADGKITEVTQLGDHPEVGGPCVRIRIFLSIFNVHINRMPCAASVRKIEPRPGKYLNAMKPESAEENESNTLVLDPDSPVDGPIVVRQISGLIARTIVCHARVGERFSSGQRFGMIKFGSGTECIVPQQPGLQILVENGQVVKAGLTPIARVAGAQK